jgi:hypothetical protein
MKYLTVRLTSAQATALIWAGNIGLEEARQEGMKSATIEAACRALEAIVRAQGFVPYRRGGAVYGRRVANEGSRTQH